MRMHIPSNYIKAGEGDCDIELCLRNLQYEKQEIKTAMKAALRALHQPFAKGKTLESLHQ